MGSRRQQPVPYTLPISISGAAGTGVVGALLFDAILPGPAGLTVISSGTAPTGETLSLQVVPVPAVVV